MRVQSLEYLICYGHGVCMWGEGIVRGKKVFFQEVILEQNLEGRSEVILEGNGVS